MLSEITSSLNQYFSRHPSYIIYNKKNLVINPRDSNENNKMNYRYNCKSDNLLQNNNHINLNNRNIRNQKMESAKRIIIPKSALGSEFTFKLGNIYTPKTINAKINLNKTYNQKDYITNKKELKNLRPKSATKKSVNISLDLNSKRAVIKNFKKIDDDFDINSNMNNFENLINIIDKNGFQKLQDEINEKKIIISQIETSIAILKNKIALSKNNMYNGCHRETKKKIKYEKLFNIGNRYKSVGKTANNYKNEINIMKNKIIFLKDETMNIKNISLKEQNDIDEINDEIKKGNKLISDRQKQIENISAAIQLLKNHISSVQQKLGRIKNIKYNYIENLNYLGNNIY